MCLFGWQGGSKEREREPAPAGNWARPEPRAPVSFMEFITI